MRLTNVGARVVPAVNLETVAMIVDPTDVDAVLAELVACVMPASDIAARAPAAPGLYAWWAAPAVLPELKGWGSSSTTKRSGRGGPIASSSSTRTRCG